MSTSRLKQMQANAAVLAEHIYCYSLITNAAWSKYMVGSTTKAALESWVDLAARVLLALLFLLSGLGKLGAYSATAAYMSSAGIPGALLPLVIATEVLGALAVILGWKTRIAAFLVAGYSLLAAFSFHRNFADQMEMIQFLKDVSIAGGFLLLVTNGPGRRSIDRRLAT